MSNSNSGSSVIQSGSPFPPEQIARYKADFERDGFLHLPQVLNGQEIEALKTGIDRVFEEERFRETHNRYSEFIAVRLFETDIVFEDILTREPIIGLVESILGSDCHLIAQNVVRNAPGQAIDFYHADDFVMFPLPEAIARHDQRMTMPVFICTVQIALTDIPSIEYGPTQYIPGSHYAGRQPDDPMNPDFEGREPVAVLCQAGDIYLHNGQCWHRGAPNTSDQVRYLLQLHYGMRWVSQRFYPFMNYQLAASIIQRADERRRRVLGFHVKGPYG